MRFEGQTVKHPLVNREIVVYALYLEGGVGKRVHTEDIALRCFRLAPDSFSWIKYPDYPDKDIVRVALTDGRKEKYGALVAGESGRTRTRRSGRRDSSKQDGWQLTEAGVAWICENRTRLEESLADRRPRAHRQEIRRALERVRRHQLYREFEENPRDFTPRLGLLAELLRCRVDAEPPIWEKRFESLRQRAQVTEDDGMVRFIDVCRQFYQSQV